MKTLEGSQVFPYLAWTAVFIGAFSLYILTNTTADRIYEMEIGSTDLVDVNNHLKRTPSFSKNSRGVK